MSGEASPMSKAEVAELKGEPIPELKPIRKKKKVVEEEILEE